MPPRYLFRGVESVCEIENCSIDDPSADRGRFLLPMMRLIKGGGDDYTANFRSPQFAH